ncbi:MAG: hypothetical protein ACC655_05940, partial [Rhodothermia bacterium]
NTDPVFPEPQVASETIADTEIELTALDPSTTYYWRVRGISDLDESTWSPADAFTTVAKVELTVPVLVRPENNVVGIQTTTVLEWMAVGNAVDYQLQVRMADSAARFVNDILTDTSSILVAPHAEAVYEWRVRGRDSDKVRGPWSGWWIFVTGQEGPLAPILSSPPQSAANVSEPVAFEWQAAPEAASHHIEVADNVLFSAPVISDTVAGNTAVGTGLDAGGEYFWRVRGFDTAFRFTWSSPNSFTLVGTIDAPDLVAPLEGSSDVSNTTDFQWNPIAGISEFEVQARLNGDSELLFDSQSNTTNLTWIAPFAETGYEWRVRAAKTGTWSPWTAFATGSTGTLAPILQSPVDGSSDVATDPSLEWTPARDAIDHEYVVLIEGSVVETGSTTGGSAQIGPLTAGATYDWRVRGIDANGQFTWSRINSFSVAGEVEAPELVAPLEGSSDVSNTTDFQWNPVGGVSEFEMQVRLSGDSQLLFDSQSSTTNLTWIAPFAETGYEWRVRAAKTGTWSPWTAFTTGSTGTLAPLLQTPADRSTDVAINPTLEWTPATAAVDHEYEIRSGDNVVETGNTPGGTVQVGPLNENTTYDWRVRGIDAAKQFTWSGRRVFATTSPGGDAVIQRATLTAPRSGLRASSLTPTLTWTAVQFADRYRVEISTSSSFSSTIVSEEVTAASFTVPLGTLAGGTTYFWRVIGLNDNSEGPASDAFTFETYSQQISINVSRSFGNVQDSSSYKLMALPGNVNVPVSSTLTGSPGEEADWRAWREGSSGLEEFTSSRSFSFSPGRGYWVLSKTQFQHQATVSTVPLTGGAHTIAGLKTSGWNIVSNALDQDVAWSDVAAENGGNLPQLWRWGGSGGWQPATTFNSATGYEAYYLQGQAGLAQIRVPFPGARQAAAKSQEDAPRFIRINLLRDNEIVSSVWAGMHPDASIGRDRFDAPLPPTYFQTETMHFLLDGDDDQTPIGISVAPDDIEGAVFEIRVETAGPGQFAIAGDGFESIPDRSVYLVNPVTGKFDAMNAGVEVKVELPETSRYVLLVGTESFIETMREEIVPERLISVGAYPSPFLSTVKLGFAIPKFELAQPVVTLDIYDVLVRTVRG